VKTLLGWTLFGRSRVRFENVKRTDSLEETHVQLLMSDEVETAFKSICSCGPEWADLNSDPDVLLSSIDDERATEIMERTLADGHQQIGLPFKPGCPC